MPEIASIPPLTKLSEEEELFRDTVRDFAEHDVRPRVAAMEKAAAIDPALLAKCFELGLMGIEIPEQHGGAGGSLFMTVLAVEELSAVDAGVAIFVDVQNTLVNNLLLKWASDDLRRRYLPRLAADLLGAYALSEQVGGEAGEIAAEQVGGEAGEIAAPQTCSAPTPSPSPSRDRMPSGSRPGRPGAASAGSSRGASCGSRTAPRPGCSSSSPTPTSRGGTRASRRSRWSVAARALRSASGRTSSGFEPPPPAS